MKKRQLPGEKWFWTISSRIIECDRPQETIHKGPQGSLTITVEFINPFFRTKRLLKTHIDEKKGNITSGKNLGLLFLVSSKMTKVTEKIIRLQQVS